MRSEGEGTAVTNAGRSYRKDGQPQSTSKFKSTCNHVCVSVFVYVCLCQP